LVFIEEKSEGGNQAVRRLLEYPLATSVHRRLHKDEEKRVSDGSVLGDYNHFCNLGCD